MGALDVDARDGDSTDFARGRTGGFDMYPIHTPLGRAAQTSALEVDARDGHSTDLARGRTGAYNP